MTTSTDELGPAEGELRTLLDLCIVRGWPVIWNPQLPGQMPHYVVRYTPNTARMISASNVERSIGELQALLETQPEQLLTFKTQGRYSHGWADPKTIYGKLK